VRHVIVIETPDRSRSGDEIPEKLQAALIRAIEIGVTEAHDVCFVQARFNVDSAIAAVREMYNVPEVGGL